MQDKKDAIVLTAEVAALLWALVYAKRRGLLPQMPFDRAGLIIVIVLWCLLAPMIK